MLTRKPVPSARCLASSIRPASGRPENPSRFRASLARYQSQDRFVPGHLTLAIWTSLLVSGSGPLDRLPPYETYCCFRTPGRVSRGEYFIVSVEGTAAERSSAICPGSPSQRERRE